MGFFIERNDGVEGKGQAAASSSSFTAELFGSKDHSLPTSSSEIFSSIFAHHSEGVAGDGPTSNMAGKVKMSVEKVEKVMLMDITRKMFQEEPDGKVLCTTLSRKSMKLTS